MILLDQMKFSFTWSPKVDRIKFAYFFLFFFKQVRPAEVMHKLHFIPFIGRASCVVCCQVPPDICKHKDIYVHVHVHAAHTHIYMHVYHVLMVQS